MRNVKQRGQLEIQAVMSKGFRNRSEVQTGKASFMFPPSISSGQRISAALFSDWAFSQSVFDQSQAVHQHHRRAGSFSHQWRSLSSPYVAGQTLPGTASPVAACQVHTWTTRDAKRQTNETHAKWMAYFHSFF